MQVRWSGGQVELRAGLPWLQTLQPMKHSSSLPQSAVQAFSASYLKADFVK